MVQKLVQKEVQKMLDQKMVQKIVQGSNGLVNILPYALNKRETGSS